MGKRNFDVSMCTYDAVEVCELIGVFMLSLLSKYRKPNLTDNSTNKLTIFTSIQTSDHQSVKKFHNQLKKDSQFCHHLKIFFRSQPFTMKNT